MGHYSPAGTLERGLFFIRQRARNGSDHAGRKSLRLLFLSLPVIAVVVGVPAFVMFLLGRVV